MMRPLFMTASTSCRVGLLAIAGLCLCLQARPARADESQARQVLQASGVQGGLVVHIGCGDGHLTAELCPGASYLVQGLDSDPARVEAARGYVASRGIYGRVSVETFDGKRLPYVDNLVNLVVADRLGDLPMDEVMRVLAPCGVAIIGGRKTVKPRPADIDEWTHFLHDASGNAVAKDREVGSPRGLRWTAGPIHTRDHDALASMSAMTTSAGRVFYILDEGATSLIHRPASWRLIARDAFNGVLLWKRDIPTWVTHLWYFRSGPVQLPRRLVSVGDRVYVTLGIDAPVSELDAATGKTLRVFEGSEKTEEMILHRGKLLTVVGDPAQIDREAPNISGYWELSVKDKPAAAKTIVARQADTGKVLWTKTGGNMGYLAPLSLVACGEKVFYLDNENLHCLALADGKELWKAPFATEGLFLHNYAPTVVACQDVVMCMTWDRLHAFSAGDGRKLWEQKGAIGLASPGDLFAIDGLAWCVPVTESIWNGDKLDRRGKITTGAPIPKEDLLGNKGEDIWGMDIHTGEVKRSIPRADVLPGGHHHRCYRNKATERYLVCGRRGLEYVDLDGNQNVDNWWVRGLCQYGVMPANGLTYVPPDPCQCFKQIMVNSFLALSSASSLDGADKGAGELVQRGPGFAAGAADKPADKPAGQADSLAAKQDSTSLAWHGPLWPAKADEWPTYRGNVNRSGSTRTPAPTRLKELWRANVGGAISAPVAAGGKVCVCQKDGLTVQCLDAATGKGLWQFVAGGRLDSPPTFCGGLCLLGSGDGWVYCLRESDGKLVWRARVAPADRLLVAESRVESVWPISGSVLVLDGVAYCAAGRSSYLDGGIRLVGLDVRTGKKLFDTTIATGPGPLGKSGPPTDGALPDVLVSDGQGLNMRHMQFDRELNPSRGWLDTLCASTGLLDDTWAHREPWQLGRAAGRAASGSKLLSFDANDVYGVVNPYTYLKATPAMWPESHDGHLHQKYSRYTAAQFPIGVWIVKGGNSPKGPALADRRPGSAKAATNTSGEQWCVKEPIQPRAMVLAGQTLFMAGWRDAVAVHELTGRPLDPNDAGPRPAFLSVRSTDDGHELANYPLDADPIFDGLIAAYGKLFISMKDGSVRCFGDSDGLHLK